nr:MAG TPA: hypothetical protein [Caudoviricetes sp.]
MEKRILVKTSSIFQLNTLRIALIAFLAKYFA